MKNVEKELRKEEVTGEGRRNGKVLWVEKKTYDLLGKKPAHKKIE